MSDRYSCTYSSADAVHDESRAIAGAAQARIAAAAKARRTSRAGVMAPDRVRASRKGALISWALKRRVHDMGNSQENRTRRQEKADRGTD